tara:strand:+ start:1660 stop:1905 length:246 start_codon:yes stop_codon:yes gene_type:complete
MPTYEFQNIKTGETFEKFMKISERETYLKENPDIEQRISSVRPVIDSARLGRMKPDQGFRDVLSSIKQNKSYTGNKVNDWK